MKRKLKVLGLAVSAPESALIYRECQCALRVEARLV